MTFIFRIWFNDIAVYFFPFHYSKQVRFFSAIIRIRFYFLLLFSRSERDSMRKSTHALLACVALNCVWIFILELSLMKNQQWTLRFCFFNKEGDYSSLDTLCAANIKMNHITICTSSARNKCTHNLKCWKYTQSGRISIFFGKYTFL